ncbi:hypothetical protein CPB86DRAFT_802054 [Serendipita vermifera]|nr:hypothetical protein CPB86DRAFT_802054 [Serendipita vermifera]
MSRVLRSGRKGATQVCSVCGEFFGTPSHLTTHKCACILKVPPDKVKSCSTCGGYFKLAKGGFIKHVQACKRKCEIKKSRHLRVSRRTESVKVFNSRVTVASQQSYVDNEFGLAENKDLSHESPAPVTPLVNAAQRLTITISPSRVFPVAPPNSPSLPTLTIFPKQLSRELRSLTDTRYFEFMPRNLPARRAHRKLTTTASVAVRTLSDDSLPGDRQSGIERKRHKSQREGSKMRSFKIIGMTKPRALRLSNEHDETESEDEMEEQLQFNDQGPCQDELAIFRISNLMRDLSFGSPETNHCAETSVTQGLSRTLQDLAAVVRVMENDDSLALRHAQPISPSPNPAYWEFKKSIRLFVRHLMGVELGTPAEAWPVVSSCGRFHFDPSQDITHVYNAQGMQFFVTSYIEAYYSKTFHPSRFVESDYVTPLLVREMYCDHFSVIRNSIRFPSWEAIPERRERKIEKQRRDTRRERKRRKLQRRRSFFSSRIGSNDPARLLSAICLDAMSDEESDNEDSTLIWIVEPGWRSAELANFLHYMDGPFQPARRRLVRPFTSDSAVIPEHLPMNFYSHEWCCRSNVGAFIKASATGPIDLAAIVDTFANV